MADAPSPEEVALWQRRLAAQANNRAWRLSESSNRSPQEDEEMLQAAHAAMHFWKIVGNANHRAHAALLVAHVYALLRLPNPARHYWAQCEPVFFKQECEPWEKALAFAVRGNVASAAGEAEVHAINYREAERLIGALPNAKDREILYPTLHVIPRPSSSSVA
jgi:hypothetical protein